MKGLTGALVVLACLSVRFSAAQTKKETPTPTLDPRYLPSINDSYPVPCIKAYRLTGEEKVVLPSECPPTLPPLRRCTCPHPDTVKAAGKDVIIFELNTDVSVKSRYVTVVVEAVVRNPTSNVQTADFETRLPKEAFISKFQIEVDGEVYDGVVKDKEQAAKEFNTSVTRGRTAGTVVQRGDDRFGTTVSVSAFCQVTFRLTYEYVVNRVRGKFRIPIHMTPELPVITRRLHVEIEDPNGVDCLEAENYDKVPFTVRDDGKVETDYELKRNELKDFVVTYDLNQTSVEQQPGTALFDNQGFVFVSYTLPQSQCFKEGFNPKCPAITAEPTMLPTPVIPSDVDSIRKCVVFVIDTSGSMSGTKMEQAIQSLVLILGTLRSYDYASIVSFDSAIQVEHNLAKVDQNLDSLRNAAQSLVAGGVTDIDGGLEKGVDVLVSAIEREIYCVHQLVLLSDGQPTSGVTNTQTIERLHRQRVADFETRTGGDTVYTYTLAYGEGADFTLMQNLAVENSGFARRIYINEDVKTQLVEFYQEISCPLLCGLKLLYNHTEITNVTRTSFSQCYYDGGQLVIGGKLTRPAEMVDDKKSVVKAFSLAGKDSGGCKTFMNQPIFVEGESSFVERAYAYLSIQQLLEKRESSSGDAKKELERTILDMALKYQFVTPLSSIIVVKPCGNRSADGADNTVETTSTPSPITITPPVALVPVPRGQPGPAPNIQFSLQPPTSPTTATTPTPTASTALPTPPSPGPNDPCTFERCTTKKRGLCTKNITVGNCTDQMTSCYACYFARDERALPSQCSTSLKKYKCAGLTDQKKLKCLRRWGKCLKKAFKDMYGKTPKGMYKAVYLWCPEYPCNE